MTIPVLAPLASTRGLPRRVRFERWSLSRQPWSTVPCSASPHGHARVRQVGNRRADARFAASQLRAVPSRSSRIENTRPVSRSTPGTAPGSVLQRYFVIPTLRRSGVQAHRRDRPRRDHIHRACLLPNQIAGPSQDLGRPLLLPCRLRHVTRTRCPDIILSAHRSECHLERVSFRLAPFCERPRAPCEKFPIIVSERRERPVVAQAEDLLGQHQHSVDEEPPPKS